MYEFIEKTIDKAEEKIKVTSLEIIVTGTKDKPYFEIKYKEVGKEDYSIGYSSYDLNNVFDWKEDCFEIVNEGGWISVNDRLPEDEMERYLVITSSGFIDILGFTKDAYNLSNYDFIEYKGMKKNLFYDCDFEYGYLELSCEYWQPLPKKPD